MTVKTAAAAPAISVPADVVALVSGELTLGSVATASVAFYEAALRAAGVDPDSLSFAETVEVTRRLYAKSADYRRSVAGDARAEREAAREAAATKRDAERTARAEAKAKQIEAQLEKLRSGKK